MAETCCRRLCALRGPVDKTSCPGDLALQFSIIGRHRVGPQVAVIKRTYWVWARRPSDWTCSRGYPDLLCAARSRPSTEYGPVAENASNSRFEVKLAAACFVVRRITDDLHPIQHEARVVMRMAKHPMRHLPHRCRLAVTKSPERVAAETES